MKVTSAEKAGAAAPVRNGCIAVHDLPADDPVVS
jgi:hypothetical protein